MINLSEVAPSIFKAILKGETGKVESRFSTGELVQGKVIKALGRDGAVVRLRGLDLIAATAKPLVNGQSILVKVEQVKPQFQVSLLLNETAAQEKKAAMLRLYLPQAMPAGKMTGELAKLVALLPKSLLKGTELDEILSKLLRKSGTEREAGKSGAGKGYAKAEQSNLLKLLGFSHESDIAKGKPTANLKSALLLLKQNMEKMGEKTFSKYSEPMEKVTRAIQNIELKQLMNIDEKLKNWEIPFWNGEKTATARLYVRREKKQGKEKNEKEGGTAVSLMVEMSRLGPVRVEARVKGKKITGDIYIGDGEKAEKVQESLPLLIQGLKKAGFTAKFQVQTAKSYFLTEKLEKESPPAVKGLLNIKA